MGLALRLQGFARSLWFDELWSTRVKLGDAMELARQAWRDIHPPFYSVLMFLWIHLFGDGERSVRLVPLAAGLAAIVLTFVLASRWLSRPAALTAAALLTCSPVHIWYSQEARPYSLSIALLLLAALTTEWLRDQPGRSAWRWLHAAALGFAMGSHFFVAPIALGLAAAAAWTKHPDRRWLVKMTMVFAAIWLVYAALRIATGTLEVGRDYLRPFTPHEAWLLFFNWFALGSVVSGRAQVLLQIAAAGLFVWGWLRLAPTARATVAAMLFAIPATLLLAMLVGRSQLYIERSAVFGLPFFFITIAKATDSRRGTAVPMQLAIVAASVVLAVMFGRSRDRWTVYKPNADFRAASAYLDEQWDRQRGCCPVYATIPAHELLYYRRHAEASLEPPADEAARGLCAAAPSADFFLLRHQFWTDGFDPVFTRLRADASCTLEEERSFFGLVLYKIHRRPIA